SLFPYTTLFRSLFILYGTRCTKHLNDHCRHNFTGKCCIRQGGQGSSTDFHFPVRYRISLQRCRRWLSDGQYYWWWFYPPFIAVVRVIWADGSWHYIALYLAVGCLLTALVAALVPKTQDE